MDSVIFPATVMKKPRHGTRFRSPATRFLSCFKYIRMTSAKASVSIIFRNGCPSSYLLEPSSISADALHGFTCEIPSSCSLELSSISAGVLHAFTRGFPELMPSGAELDFR